jgi:NCS2 family nucleobase:cation symporter-2
MTLTPLPVSTDTDPAPVVGIDDKPALGRRIALGGQQLLVSNVWLDPLFIGAVGGLAVGVSTGLVAVTFLAAGIATLVQTTRLVRLPVVEGPSSAFDTVAIAAARSGQLAAASTGLLIGAGLVLLASVTGVMGTVRKLFTPAVTGTVVLLVGLLLAQFTFLEVAGGDSTSPTFGSPKTLLIAFVTGATVIGLSLLGRGSRWRSYSFLVGLFAGDLLALLLGRLDFASVGDAAWFRVPSLLPYGSLTFDLGLTITMSIIFFAAVAEAVGTYQATAAYAREELTARRIDAGIAGEAGGTMLSALLGGFGTTAYAQNFGLMKLTGVASRHVVRVTAILMICLAFLPKVAAVLVATPAPVVGGLFLPAAASVVFTGISTVASVKNDERQILVACIAVMAGLGVPGLGTAFTQGWPKPLADLASQGIVVGTVVAVVLQLVLMATRPRGAEDASGATVGSRVADR